MEELRQEFLAEAVSKLENLQTGLRSETLSEEFEREIFRTFHTLKGTSQTFNLNVSGRLAHEIENLLQFKRDHPDSPDADFMQLLKEGVWEMMETFQNARDKREIIFPVGYVEKLHSLIPNPSAAAASEDLSAIVPQELLRQFSSQEKDSLNAALASGSFVYLIEAGFEFADFAEKFKELRIILGTRGAVIANFSSPRFAAENKIGFQIFFVSAKDKKEINGIIQPFGAALLFDNAGDENNLASDLRGVLAQAEKAGRQAAQRIGKQIEFECASDEVELPAKNLKIVSEILLHLVRNAVDHAIETTGKIKLEILERESSLLLRVSDDGRGLNLEKIRLKAIEKNLIRADEVLSAEDVQNLIFRHGFSTAEKLSEISGRGVGLDVVAERVKNSGGGVSVETTPGMGTTFEISLPKDQS